MNLECMIEARERTFGGFHPGTGILSQTILKGLYTFA